MVMYRKRSVGMVWQRLLSNCCYLAALTEQGRLIEQGTHDELVRGGGLYAYPYSQQLAT
jgi:ABC-type bacteriocin/lantibiotic exporter with double-glycine peptidase domain